MIGFPLGLILIVFCGCAGLGCPGVGGCRRLPPGGWQAVGRRLAEGPGCSYRRTAQHPSMRSPLHRASCSGDLFTGNCFYSFSAVVEGRLPLWAGFRLLLVSWLSNLLGCLLMLGLFHGARVWPHRCAPSWPRMFQEHSGAASSPADAPQLPAPLLCSPSSPQRRLPHPPGRIQVLAAVGRDRRARCVRGCRPQLQHERRLGGGWPEPAARAPSACDTAWIPTSALTSPRRHHCKRARLLRGVAGQRLPRRGRQDHGHLHVSSDEWQQQQPPCILAPALVALPRLVAFSAMPRSLCPPPPRRPIMSFTAIGLEHSIASMRVLAASAPPAVAAAGGCPACRPCRASKPCPPSLPHLYLLPTGTLCQWASFRQVQQPLQACEGGSVAGHARPPARTPPPRPPTVTHPSAGRRRDRGPLHCCEPHPRHHR